MFCPCLVVVLFISVLHVKGGPLLLEPGATVCMSCQQRVMSPPLHLGGSTGIMVKFPALVSGRCVAVELDCVELQFPGVPVSVLLLDDQFSLLQKQEKEDLLSVVVPVCVMGLGCDVSYDFDGCFPGGCVAE
jgi:hypothetical protein